MSFIIGDKEPFLPAYAQPYNPVISYAIGNRDIGLLFGTRTRLSVLWQVRKNVKDELVLCNENGNEFLLGVVKGIKNLSFLFDPFSFPIVAVEVEREDWKGVEVYKFNSIGGDEEEKKLIISLPDCKQPKLLPTNISDLGSVLNQSLLLYVDSENNIISRSAKTNFTEIEGEPVSSLETTDVFLRAGITQSGKIQIEIIKLKETP